MASYEKAKDEALKILGKDATLPDDKLITKGSNDVRKAHDDFAKARDSFENKLTDYQGDLEGYITAIEQLEARVDKDDFNLDTKNKDDAKKIKAAQDVLDDYLKDHEKMIDSVRKAMKEVGRHLIMLGKYKMEV